MKVRYMGENNRFTLDLIRYCKEGTKKALLLLVDFEKAFEPLFSKPYGNSNFGSVLFIG